MLKFQSSIKILTDRRQITASSSLVSKKKEMQYLIDQSGWFSGECKQHLLTQRKEFLVAVIQNEMVCDMHRKFIDSIQVNHFLA
jgi:hypothetical protein